MESLWVHILDASEYSAIVHTLQHAAQREGKGTVVLTPEQAVSVGVTAPADLQFKLKPQLVVRNAARDPQRAYNWLKRALQRAGLAGHVFVHAPIGHAETIGKL